MIRQTYKRTLLLVGALLLATAALAESGKLVLYTSQPNQDAQQTVDAFKALRPGVEVEWVRDGTTQVMAKLQAEFAAGSPQPDVLLVADVINLEALKRDGRLMAYDTAPVGKYDPKLYDADRTYFSTKLITTGIVYNNNAPMHPQSWKDLTSAQAKGQVTMASPLYSGAAFIHVSALSDQPEMSWAFFQGLADNGAQAGRGNGGVFKAVAEGQKLYGVVIDFLPIRESMKGSPVTFVFPTEGVSAVTEPVAILKTARNVEAAKAFVDFVLSKEGQELAASQGYLPAHPDVAPPAGFPKLSEIDLLPLNAEKALNESEQTKMRFADLFGQ